MPQTVIQVSEATVVLGRTRVLHDVSLNVSQGESLALLGANGSGKSSLVRTILGVNPLTSGSVELFGENIHTAHSKVPWMKIGYVPQRVAASSGIPATALEVVQSGLLGPGKRLFADRGPTARKKALQALDLVGLKERAHEHVQVFSGGQAQRVLIARALVRSPELLLLDEPLAGIDRESRETLADILSHLRERGTTLVTVLHEMGELTDLVDRAVTLEDGHILADTPLSHGIPEVEPGHDHPDHDHVHPHESPSSHPHHAPVLKMEISS